MRWTFRILIGMLLAAVAVMLAFVAIFSWYTNVSWPDHRRQIAEAERDMARDAAAKAEGAMASAAADGRLTDDEIETAVGGPVWDVRRADLSWVIRANFHGTDPLCFSFDITLPLGPDTRVARTELPECPAITPVG